MSRFTSDELASLAERAIVGACLLVASAVAAHDHAGLGAGEGAAIQKAAPQCCGERDCVRVAVRDAGDGWVVRHPTTGESFRVRYQDAQASPTGADIACFVPVEPAPALGDFRAGCLFIAPRA